MKEYYVFPVNFFLRFYCARENLNDLMSFGLVCIYKVSLDILKI